MVLLNIVEQLECMFRTSDIYWRVAHGYFMVRVK
jgi:hypothetical protein